MTKNIIKKIKDILAPLYLIFISNFNTGEIYHYEKLKLLYIAIPKTGNSSINSLLLKKEGYSLTNKNYQVIHKIKKNKKISQKKALIKITTQNYYSFAFVRNPYDRLVSCYINKIKNEEHFIKKAYLGYFYKDMSFKEFVIKISKIPEKYREVHFKSQFSFIYYNNKKLPKYIGRFEKLNDDFSAIKKKYNLEELPKLNSTKKNKNFYKYYDLELAKLVYNIYKKDFKLWYPNEYNNLLKYLNKKKL